MKKLITIAFFLVFLIGNAFGQSNDNIKLYSAKELRDDVDSLTKYIEEVHPNAFFKFPKDKFYKEADSIKSVIVKPMSVFDFYFLVSPLVAKLEDGHTSIQPPINEYFSTNPCIFPYLLKFSAKEPYIVFDRGIAKTMKCKIPHNAIIISINDIASNQIINDLANLSSGESKSYRLSRLNQMCFFYLYELFGEKSNYTIKYNSNNNLEIENISCIHVDSLIQMKKRDTSINKEIKPKDYSLIINRENKTAIIDFESFNDIEKFKIFIDSAFQQIKDNKIENLIIDIRNNGGGSSNIGDEFFQYISHENFMQVAKSKTKNSRLMKEYYKMLFAKTQDSLLLPSLNNPNGLVENQRESLIKLRDNPLRFNGTVYLLTSTYTFSSAAFFAQCFKYYKMGKIIGEETGGWMVSYGDHVFAELPNSKLTLSISHILWYEIGAKENDFHGTIPDIIVPSEKALDYTLELIKKQ